MSKQTIQTKIDIVKNETQSKANSKVRIAELFTLLNNEKFDNESTFTKIEITDKINEIKDLALDGFIGGIDPNSILPDRDFWAFASEGNYPDGIIVEIGKISILTRVQGEWRKADIKIPKNDSFVVTRPEWFNFTENTENVWKVNFDAGTVFFGNESTGVVNAECEITIDNSNYNYIYGNLTDKKIYPSMSPLVSGELIYIGIIHPNFNLFSLNCPFSVNGKPLNLTFPAVPKNHYVITKPEYFNIINDGGWKINILDGSFGFGESESQVFLNDGNQTILLDQPVYNFIHLNIPERKFYNFPSTFPPTEKDFFLVAIFAPAFELFYSICPYAFNGKPYNVGSGSISTGDNFNSLIDVPLLTNTISFKDDQETPIYKDSIFKSLNGGFKSNLVLETKLNGQFKRYDIQNPTYLKASQIGTENKYVIEGKGFNRKIWKEILKVYKGETIGLPATVKGMGIGDSLYQGNANTNVAPIAILKDRFANYGVTLQTIGTFNQDDGRGVRNDIISEGRGFWSYKSFTGKDNQPYGQSISIATGTGLTGKFQNPFLRLATNTDKTDHPDWCFTNIVQDPENPDGVSYSTNSTYNNYYIFDFANYITVRNLQTPDFIMISLGINDWQESEINVTDEFLCFTILYTQIRAAFPNVPLIITPTNGIMPENQQAWQNEMFPLAERIIKALENYQLADSNLHICPIYTHVSRQNAGCVDLDLADLSVNNNMKISTTWDVHVLDKESSMLEYMQTLESIVLTVIS